MLDKNKMMNMLGNNDLINQAQNKFKDVQGSIQGIEDRAGKITDNVNAKLTDITKTGMSALDNAKNLGISAAANLGANALSSTINTKNTLVDSASNVYNLSKSNNEIKKCVIKEFCNVFNNSEAKMKQKLQNKLDEMFKTVINGDLIDIKIIVKNKFINIIYDFFKNSNYKFKHAIVQNYINNQVDLKTKLSDRINNVKSNNLVKNEENILIETIDFLRKEINEKKITGGDYKDIILNMLNLYKNNTSEIKINYTIRKIFKKKLEKILSDDNLIFNLRENVKQNLSNKISKNVELIEKERFNVLEHIIFNILIDNESVKKTFKNGVKNSIENSIQLKNKNSIENSINNVPQISVDPDIIKNILKSFNTSLVNPLTTDPPDDLFKDIDCNKKTNNNTLKKNAEYKLKKKELLKPIFTDQKCLDNEIHTLFMSLKKLNDTLDTSTETAFDKLITPENINMKQIIESKISTIISEFFSIEEYKKKIYYSLFREIIEMYKDDKINNFFYDKINMDAFKIVELFIGEFLYYDKEKKVIGGNGEKIVNLFNENNRIDDFNYAVKHIIKNKIEKYVFNKGVNDFFIIRFKIDLDNIINKQICFFVNDNKEVLNYFLHFTLIDSEEIKKIFIQAIKNIKNSRKTGGGVINNSNNNNTPKNIIIQYFNKLISDLDTKINKIIETKIGDNAANKKSSDTKIDEQQVAAIISSIIQSKNSNEIKEMNKKIAAMIPAIIEFGKIPKKGGRIKRYYRINRRTKKKKKTRNRYTS